MAERSEKGKTLNDMQHDSFLSSQTISERLQRRPAPFPMQ
jgi:hypothetical protein